MTNAPTAPDSVTLTTRPSGLVTVTGWGALRAVTDPTGHPVVTPTPRPVTLELVTSDPGPVTPEPVTPEVTAPAAPTDPPRVDTPPVTPVSQSAGQDDQVTGKHRPDRADRRIWPTRKSAEPAPAPEPQPAPAAAAPPEPSAEKAKPKALPRWLNLVWLGSLWAVTGVVTYLASFGQVLAAEVIHIDDHRKYLVPAGLELVAVALFVTGYVVGRLGFSPWPAWSLGLGVGGFAVFQVHEHSPNDDQGVLYGAFTAGTLILWLIKLVYSLAKYRREVGTSAAGHLKFGKLWRDNPRLTRHAARIGRRFQLNDINAALEYAEVMIAMLDDTKTANGVLRRKINALKQDLERIEDTAARQKHREQIADLERQILSGKERRRMAWRATQKHAGRQVAKLPSFAAVERISVLDDPAPAAPTPAPAPAAPAATAPTGQETPAPAPAPRRKPAPVPSPADDVDKVAQEWAAQARAAKPAPPAAPVSPAPAGLDAHQAAQQLYATALAQVMDTETGIPEWKTRAAKITAGDLKRLGVTKADGEPITGQPTLVKLSWLIETLSDRAGLVPADIYTKYGWTPKRKAAA